MLQTSFHTIVDNYIGKEYLATVEAALACVNFKPTSLLLFQHLRKICEWLLKRSLWSPYSYKATKACYKSAYWCQFNRLDQFLGKISKFWFFHSVNHTAFCRLTQDSPGNGHVNEWTMCYTLESSPTLLPCSLDEHLTSYSSSIQDLGPWCRQSYFQNIRLHFVFFFWLWLSRQLPC